MSNIQPTISKIGQRRQVVIPKAICDELKLVEGGFVEVSSERGAIIIKPKMFIDPDTFSPADLRSIRRGIEDHKKGRTKPWSQIKDELGL